MSTMIECNAGNINCERLEGTNLTAVYTTYRNGTTKVWIWDQSSGKYIAKGTLSSQDTHNIKYDKEHYTINIDSGKVSVMQYKADEPHINTSPAGTYYTAETANGKITALVIGGVVIGLVVAGVVIWFLKNPPVAGAAGIGTGELIGGVEAARKVGSILDKIGAVLIPIIFGNDKVEASELFLQAQSTQPIAVDPILLDLNGDGVIGTTTLENGVYFDHQKDGFGELSAWVDENDGILVIDKNGDGVINDGGEVFGDNYVKSNGNKASSGFDALADLDSNGDGVISAEDSEFSNIKILKGDGTLISLEEAGITSINLSSESVGSADENGNTLVSQGTSVRNDGSVGNLGDFNLIVDKMDSFAVEWLEESEEISALPEVLGSGTVYSLHQAMVRDESGVLKGLVEDFIEAVGSSEKRSILVNILYKWTGADGVADGSRGSNFDAKKLYVLEKFIGKGFVGVDGSSNPNNQACHILENAFNKLLNNIYASLMSQTELKDVFDKLEINYDYDSERILYSLDKVREYIDSVLLNDEIKGKELLSEFSNCFVNLGLRDNSNYEEYYDYYVSKGEDYRYLLETIDKVVIRGTESDDSIEGTMGTDAVFGGGGNDTIMTRQGDDLVYGGEGDGWLLKVA